jgi:5-methylcytosine-specific restriction endonuclease McrA
MILTIELLKPFRKKNKTYYVHQLRIMGLDTEIKGWVTRLIGSEVTEETYEKAKKSLDYVKGRVTIRQNNSKIKKTKRIIIVNKASSVTDTRDFIEKYIENMSNESINGFMVPGWIHSNIDWASVRIRIMKLPYQSFLKTYYWKAITMYLKHKNGDHCTYCPAETGLQVHHKTYDHHGIELFYMDELEVLCDKCHKAKH